MLTYALVAVAFLAVLCLLALARFDFNVRVTRLFFNWRGAAVLSAVWPIAALFIVSGFIRRKTDSIIRYIHEITR